MITPTIHESESSSEGVGRAFEEVEETEEVEGKDDDERLTVEGVGVANVVGKFVEPLADAITESDKIVAVVVDGIVVVAVVVVVGRGVVVDGAVVVVDGIVVVVVVVVVAVTSIVVVGVGRVVVVGSHFAAFFGEQKQRPIMPFAGQSKQLVSAPAAFCRVQSDRLLKVKTGGAPMKLF
jgi:hypothetical protein